MDKIAFMHCELNRNDGETVEGITLVVDGPVKTVLDYILMKKGNQFKNHTEIVHHALMDGLRRITDEMSADKASEE